VRRTGWMPHRAFGCTRTSCSIRVSPKQQAEAQAIPDLAEWFEQCAFLQPFEDAKLATMLQLRRRWRRSVLVPPHVRNLAPWSRLPTKKPEAYRSTSATFDTSNDGGEFHTALPSPRKPTARLQRSRKMKVAGVMARHRHAEREPRYPRAAGHSSGSKIGSALGPGRTRCSGAKPAF
jgi:hypothetical protein